MTVLIDQHVSRRTTQGRAASEPLALNGRAQRRRIRRSTRRTGLTAFFLVLVVIALGAAVAILVPRLEEYSRNVMDAQLASAPALPGFTSAQVASQPETMEAADAAAEPVVFELTDDLEYVVGEGETLSEIALAHDVDFSLLARFNEIDDPDTIAAGLRIVIPGTLSRGRGINESLAVLETLGLASTLPGVD